MSQDVLAVSGDIPDIIANAEGLYDGNLAYYYRWILDNAQNLNNPYHNYRHMMHVPWQCHNACKFYAKSELVSPRNMRALLIAGLFHDFNHCGMFGDDDLNIERALRGLGKALLPEDHDIGGRISDYIQVTQYPYHIPQSDLDLCGSIIRDADLTQVFSPAWIQQVVFGLAAEWRKKPIEVLRMQEPFLKNLTFHTLWAKTFFPRHAIEAKREEVRKMLEILDPQ